MTLNYLYVGDFFFSLQEFTAKNSHTLSERKYKWMHSLLENCLSWHQRDRTMRHTQRRSIFGLQSRDWVCAHACDASCLHFWIRDVHLCHKCESSQHVAGNASGHQRANRPILPFPCSEGKPTPPVRAKLTQWNRSKCVLSISCAFCVRGQPFQCSNVNLLFWGSRTGWVFLRMPLQMEFSMIDELSLVYVLPW